MKYQKPSFFWYGIARMASWFVATFLFKRKFLRNEIKNIKGPYVVIANHQAMLDFVNLIGATPRRMSFVISKSFFSSLPIQGIMRKMGLIPKQQFQTTADDLKKMKRVIDAGSPLVIYPAGLMCEDGLSTPIPAATYKFLKWLNADVYVARTQGTYFVMPKWAKGFRPGRTTMDIYKLFSREQLERMDISSIREKTDEALLYDAYREQELLRAKYRSNQNIEGLENVLYQCPECGEEFSTEVVDGSTIRCSKCGFARKCDEYGFLAQPEEPWRYVSDWSRWIYEELKKRVLAGEEDHLSAQAQIKMVDPKKHKFCTVGEGVVELSKGQFTIDGRISGETVHITVPVGNVPILPFSPGKHLEIQHGGDIYRCVFRDGHLVMKFINLLKIFYELAQTMAKAG